MNPSYSSPRQFPQSPPNNYTPFYNPQQQKDPTQPFIPTALSRSPNSLQYIHQQPPPSSKSYAAKPNFDPPKISNNNSAYLKSTLDSTPPASNYPNFSPSYPKMAGEMTKSSFHDAPRMPEPNNYNKTAERPSVGTPGRRQPRYSEPANIENVFEPNQDTKSSFIPYGSSKGMDQKQDEIHFYKKHGLTTPQTHKQQQKQKQTKDFKDHKEGKQVREPKEWARRTPPSNFNPKGRAPTLDNFQLFRNLGQGKYGKVFLARQKSSHFICALKVIEKAILIQQQIVDQFIRQVKIQMFLNHPNIIKMYGCFEDQQHIYVILEVAMAGQLYQQLKRSEPMPEAKVATLMKQICTAVEELHHHRVIHRDIKPENIVLHEGVVKLCDFGWSVHLDNKMRTTFCGTPLYVCPEILRGKEYDEKIDIWSIGIMMYEMLVGENPFKINKEEELIKIVKDEIAIPSYVYVSKEARDFLDKCLQKNPDDRVTIKELSNHPFFSKNADKQKIQKKMTF